MPAPAWFFLCAMLMVAIALVTPGPDLLPSWLTGVGFALVLGGMLLNAFAMDAFRRGGTPMDPDLEPTALVQDGPYRFTRNPMYAGGVLILSGLVFVIDEPRSAVVLPLYVLLVARSFVPADERRMRALFGDAWLDYTKRVRRWM
jgi:protein-S-isoprenylcysteine O-methyltransferase Ste14